MLAWLLTLKTAKCSLTQMKKSGVFENFERNEKIKVSSNRSFGMVFSVFFLIISCISLYKRSDLLNYWVAMTCVVFLVTIIAPTLLTPFNLLWAKFGLLLHKITSPIIMGIMFFVVFLPMGLVLRFFKKLSLTKSFDSSLSTYWIERTPAGHLPNTMKDSF